MKNLSVSYVGKDVEIILKNNQTRLTGKVQKQKTNKLLLAKGRVGFAQIQVAGNDGEMLSKIEVEVTEIAAIGIQEEI